MASDGYQETPLGLFPVHFEHSKLEALCVGEAGIRTGPVGSQLHQRDYLPVGTPIITVEYLGDNRILHADLPRVGEEDTQRLDRFTLSAGDIVFSRVGAVDRRALVRNEEDSWLFSGRRIRVRPNPEVIDSAYLSWYFGLPSFKEYVRRIAFGATMASLNTKVMKGLPVFYPPLPEQRATRMAPPITLRRLAGTMLHHIASPQPMPEPPPMRPTEK